jgi:hypothetical protein
MSDQDEAKGPGFTVVDRRSSAAAADPEPARAPEAAPSGFDFAMLVQSIAITALHHLGITPTPGGDPVGEPNLPLARQNIEILELLQVKTRGNLEQAETHLLSSLLYEVRMHYVEASRSKR